jgi:DNA (cytosine-5)-methyltransferase 1
MRKTHMKILNLYAGIGGNRKFWDGDIHVTAVEYNPQIAEIYSHFHPDDTVIVGDAHQHLLEHYAEFDFIWSSPPCPTHSRIRRMGVQTGNYPAAYPDISIWQEITLLQHFSEALWVVENVQLYYDPIIPPAFKMDRHFFWSNFYVPPRRFKGRGVPHKNICGDNHVVYGVDISGFAATDKRRLLRNMVNPELGEHILDTARQRKAETQLELFLHD